MPYYADSTQTELGSLNRGIMVHTSTLANLTYLHQDQWEIFNVYGRIKVIGLWCEIVVACSANATTLKYNFTSSSPVITVADISAASGSLSAKAAGTRVTLVGGDITTAAAVTAGVGRTYGCVLPMLIGTIDGTGTIGFVTAGADQASGTCKFTICYVPVDPGSYVSAVL